MPQGPIATQVYGRTPSGETKPANLDADGNLIVTPLGGGDAVTIADGADITQGAKADAAWTTGAGSVVALLKAIATRSGGYPVGATPLTAASGNEANTNAVATLAAAASKTTYITGFTCTGLGATAAGVALVTLVGTITGTLTYVFPVPIGATVGATPLNVQFPMPIPASAVNTAIVVTLPAFGTGNTNAAVVATGFQL